MSGWVDSPATLKDFLSYVVIYAPDSFPDEDYLQPEEQMTLAMAFGEIEKGVRLMYDSLPSGILPERVDRLVAEARTAYQDGLDVRGAHLLQELEELLFRNQRT